MKPRWPMTWLRRWGVEPKRGLAALLLVAVALLLWGRLMLKNAPRTALADPKQILAATPSPPPVHPPTRLTREIPLALAPSRPRDLFAMAQEHDQIREFSPESAPPAKSKDQSVDSGDRSLAARQAAAAMKLQTTILGQPPRAMIDGKLVAPGQTIKGFVVVEIQSRQVILQKDGLQILLEM